MTISGGAISSRQTILGFDEFEAFCEARRALLKAKLAVVMLTFVYHVVCGRMLRQFERGDVPRSHVWYRWFNEIPVLLLTAAVILVVLKPF